MLVLTQLCVGAFIALWLLGFYRAGNGLENCRAGLAGTGRDQSGCFDSAPRASDSCVAGHARSAAFLAEPRSADAFVVRRRSGRIRGHSCSSGCLGRMRRGFRHGARGPCGHHLLGAHLYRARASCMVQRLHARRVLFDGACCWARPSCTCSIRSTRRDVRSHRAPAARRSSSRSPGSFSGYRGRRSSSFGLPPSCLAGRLRALFVTRLAILIAVGIVIPLAASSPRLMGGAFAVALAGELLGRLPLLRQRGAQEHRGGLRQAPGGRRELEDA